MSRFTFPSSIRDDFPILKREVRGKTLVYLDNAATSQKPQAVLDASADYYKNYNANIHRGVYHLAQLATEAHEQARHTIAKSLNALTPEEIIFTSGTTDGINLVSNILGWSGMIQAGDEILISTLEHHSNIVPWQMLCERTGAILKVIPCDDHAVLDQQAYHSLLNPKTKVVALTHISNAFGTVNPIREMTALAHAVGAVVLIDGAQSVPHQKVDVQDIDADFLVFSGHKLFAPTGIGVLYGKKELLEKLPPNRGGGEMIKEVTFEKTSYNDLPFKYEAGTPNIEGAIALAAAFQYAEQLGFDNISAHEHTLVREAAEKLSKIEGITLYGPEDRSGAVSFNINGIHHFDLGTLLDQMGVSVRTGHHCCQPLMARFGITGTVRASVGPYNTIEEIDLLISAVDKARKMLV